MDSISSQSERIRLSPDGPEFSRIVAGTMKWGIWGKGFSTDQMNSLMQNCISKGITTFDHADIYGDYTTAEAFGKTIAQSPGLRKMVQLFSKCGIKMKTPNRPDHKIKSYDTSAAHILQSVENSLKNLRTDYLDLLLIHRPSPLMDADEIAKAFDQLKQAGKVLHLGVSNFSPAQFALLHDRIPLVTNQIRISAAHLSPFLDGSLDQAQRLRVAPMAWSPVGGMRMFGNEPSARIKRLRAKVQEIAKELDCQEEQVLIAWLLKHPSRIIPVMGTTREDRLQAAVDARKLILSRQQWFEIWEASLGEEVP
ncbi:MAG: hypothetical protein GYB31_03660 [Bacteroidetes bacterium]|nr:hypothetical protein [Bacteroidota bacterium]